MLYCSLFESKGSKERAGNLHSLRAPVACPRSFYWGAIFSLLDHPLHSKQKFPGQLFTVDLNFISGRCETTSVENESASGKNISPMEAFSALKQLYNEWLHWVKADGGPAHLFPFLGIIK